MTHREFASPTRFNILLATEINRLNHSRDARVVYDVAKALDVEAEISAWVAQPAWRTAVEERCTSAPHRCPNPHCRAPVGHIHTCPPV
jgi:hypothetical protein